MMGLGSLGNGGPSASSPSSLSPLAPPFTVDRSNQKSNSSQLLQFSDLHSLYATPFDNNWACPHPLTSTLATSLLDDADSIRTTCQPLSNDYHFLASESVNPPGAHWPTSNPLGQYMTNAFLYSCYSTPYSCQDVSPAVNDAHRVGAHWPNSNPTVQPMTNAFMYSCDSTPYSRQDVSPAVNETAHAVSINRPNYDMSPTPGIVCTNMSSPLAYTGRFSDLEYTSQWGSFWNGLAGENQGKLIELEGSVCLDESSVSDSIGYNNNAKKGIHTADGVTQHEKVSAVVSQGKHSDAFGSENYPMSINATQLDDKLLLEQDNCLIPFGSSRTLTSRTHSAIPYPHPKAPSLDSVTNTSQYVPYEKCFELLDSIGTNCISSTKSSTLVIRPPATGTISSPPTIFSSKTIDTVSVHTSKSRGSDSQNFSTDNDPGIPQNTDYKEGCFDARGLSSHKERNNHKNATSSSIIGEQSNKQHTVGNLYHAIEDKSGFQGPDLSIAADFSLTIDSGIDSTENSTDSLDHLNTGVDSPCWKGAPEWHFSPFEVAIPQLFTNRLEASNTLNLQGTQTFPSQSQPMNFSLQQQCENNNLDEKSCAEGCFSMLQKRCSDAIETAKVHRSSDVEESRNSNIKGVQFSENIEKSSNFSFISEPKNDSEPSHFRKLGLEEGNSTSSKVKKTQDGVAEGGIKTTDVTEVCHFPAVKNVSCLLSFEEDTADFATPRSRESTPKMDVQMLVQTMCNLSELLRFHCSVNSCPLEGHEHETLEIVMDNLQACMSKKIVDTTSVPKSIVPQKGTHCDSSPNQYMGPSIGQSKITNKAPAISIGQQEKYNASGKKTEKFTSYVSLKNETEVPKFDCMAIKAVLDENFQSEEKVESQSPLYKNLWLEAEAELCSINYRTRHDRMKIEMKKSKFKKEKENNIPEDKILSSSFFAYPSVSYALVAKTKHGRLPFETAEESTLSGTTSHIDDEEASVMARLRILTCRGKNSKSIDMEEQVPSVVNTGTAGERSQIPFMGGDELGDMKAVAKPHLQRERESIKEFRICINDNEQMVPFARNNAHPIQDTSSCCYDNTPSDWEHVLKDDYALQ